MNYLKVLAILSLLFIFCGSVYGAGEADSPDINGVNAVIDDTITVENASLTYDKLITSNNCEEVVIGDNSIWDVPIREGPIVENDNTSIPDITLKGENGNNMSFNNPADVFINESFNFQMVFKNLGDATGFQPCIQLIAPKELTHFTVSYSNRKIVPIKVGIFNESTYDNTTGLYTLRDPFTKKEVHGPANSTFYILQYPLGSFTVDAPDAVLNITSGIGVLKIGKLLNFTVTPVFRYGNSPIDDPVNYPPIYGETVTGWVNPVVVKIDKSSSLNEHETATGSNFPFSYSVNINIANGAKIENITITDVIPSDVMYLGSPVLYDSKGRVIDSGLYTIEEPAGNKTGGKLILKLKEAVGDLSTTSITLKYKAYAPEFDNSTGDNITIINSETGECVAAASTVDMNYTYVNDTYNASNSYSIYLKSLATQKYSEILTGSGQLHPVVPHNLIVYKIDFEISDYFAFDDLVIYDKFDTHKVGSAQKFLTEYEPVLSIYGKTYELNESYYSVVSLGDIDESVTFYISKFLKDNNISTSLKGGYYTNRSVNQGAMVGSLNFVAKVIIHYSNGSSVVSNDLVINYIKTSATVLNTFNTVSDNSYTQLRVPSVTLKKDIIAVDGEIINDTDFYKVYPGQNITFVLDIHFPTGSVNDFIVTDFLPIPLFNLKGFNLVNSTTGVIPKCGYWAYANDSGFLYDENTGKVIVPKIGIDTFNNALSFNFGNTLDNLAHPVDVRLWFTFQVSSEPMADQLNLANLAEMKFKDSIDVVYASSNIVLMLTNEPELKITKYVNDTKILENIENATEVEYNITITNTGHSAAYDIIVADDFVNRTTSNGITKADVKSVSLVYSNGTVVDITAFKDDLFTKGYMIAQLAQNTSCSIIYTVRFSEYLIPKESIVNNVWITNFAAYPNSTNFATNKDKYRDNATIIAKGLNITKEFIGSNVTDNTEILFVGEVGIYKITVNFPDLRVPNLVIKDESYGIKYTNFTITTSDGVTVPEYAYTVTYTSSATHPEKSYLTIDFNGDLVPAYAKNNQLIVNAYYTVVNNENVIPTGADSATTSNHASISWTNNTLNSDTVYVDIYQPKIDINKVFGPNIVQGNDEASFTITVTNSGKGTAYNTTITDDLTEFIKTFVNSRSDIGVTILKGNETGKVIFNWNNDVATLNVGELLAGQSVSAKFTFNVKNDVVIGKEFKNIAKVDYYSIFNETKFDEKRNYSNQASSTLHTYDAKVNKTVFNTTIVNGKDKVTVGENVTYNITVILPVGKYNILKVTDTLPEGLKYIDGSIVVYKGNTQNKAVEGKDYTVTVNGNIVELTFASEFADEIIKEYGGKFQAFLNATVLNVNNNKAGAVKTNKAVLTWNTHESTSDAAVGIVEPAIDITKNFNVDNVIGGDVIYFDITVTNRGQSPLFNVTLSDDLSDLISKFVSGGINITSGGAVVTPTWDNNIVSINIAELGIGKSLTYRFTFKIREDVVISSSYTNTANAIGYSAPSNGRNYYNESKDTLKTKMPSITKLVIGTTLGNKEGNIFTPNIGENVTYQIMVKLPKGNYTNLQVKDILPQGFEYLENSVILSNGTLISDVSVNGNLVTINFGNTTSYKYSDNIIFNLSAVVLNDQSNKAQSIKSNNVELYLNDDKIDNSNAQVKIAEPNISVVKTSDKQKYEYYENATYSIVITNNGNGIAYNITIKDVLPLGLKYTGINSTSKSNGWVVEFDENTRTFTVNGLNLTVGDKFTFTYKVSFDEWEIDGVKYSPIGQNFINSVNVAYVSINGTNPNNRTYTTQTTKEVHVTEADLNVVKNCNNEVVIAGEDIYYTIIITNNGLDTAQNVKLNEYYHSEYLTNLEYSLDGKTWNVYNKPIDLGNINSKASKTVYIRGHLDAGIVDDTILNNTVRVNTTTGELKLEDNEATNIKNVTTLAELHVTKVNITEAIAGKIIKYEIVITNNGPSYARDIILKDIYNDSELTNMLYSLDGQSWTRYDASINIGTLANGQNKTILFEGFIKTTVRGNVINKAVIGSSTKLRENSTLEDDVAVNVKGDTTLDITKVANTTLVNPGDVIKYTVQITAGGLSDSLDVILTDNLSEMFFDVSKATYSVNGIDKGVWIGNANLGTISSGMTVNVVITVPVKAYVDVGKLNSITNFASVINSDKKAANDTNIVPINVIDLAVNKTANHQNKTYNYGDNVEYVIEIVNNGLGIATDIIATDNLPEGLKFINANVPGGWTLSISNNKITINGEKLANGEKVLITIIAKAAKSNTTLINNIKVNGTGFDSNISNNNDSETIKITPLVDLAITKVVDNANPLFDSIITYTITVVNNGPDASTDVVVKDIWPANGLKFITSTGTYNPATGIWNVGELGSNEIATLTITAKTTAVGKFENKVSVNGTGYDSNLSNNNASVNITVPDCVILNITKVATGGIVSEEPNKEVIAGEKITYTVIVSNYGPSVATNVYLTDLFNADELLNMEYNSNGNWVKYNNGIALGDIDVNEAVMILFRATVNHSTRGLINNTVKITTDIKDARGNFEANETVKAIDNSTLVINKTSNVDAINPGDLFNYTIVITAEGSSDSLGVILTDKLDQSLLDAQNAVFYVNGNYVGKWNGSYNIGTLKTGNSVTVTIEVKALNSANKDIFNKAIVENEEGFINESNKTVHVNTVDLAINKTSDKVTYKYLDNVIYTIVVTNHGSDDSFNVTVRDMLPNTLRFISASGNYDPVTGIWFIGHLAKGQSATLTITAQAIFPGIITNDANVTGSGYDVNLTNNHDNITITVPDCVILNVNKVAIGGVINITGGIKNVVAGEEVIYQVLVSNHGPSTAVNVVLTDNYQTKDLTVVAYSLDNITWIPYTKGANINLGDMTSGSSILVYFKAMVNASTRGIVHNVVNITTDTDDVRGIFSAEEHVNVMANSTLKVDKTAEIKELNPGDTIHYIITVTAGGSSDSLNIVLKDILDSTLLDVNSATYAVDGVNKGVWTGSLSLGKIATGNSVTVDIWAKVLSSADRDVFNLVNVTSDEHPEGNTSNTTVHVRIVDLAVDKLVNNSVPKYLDMIEYTIVVVNNGPDKSFNVTVGDLLPDGVKFIISNGQYNPDTGVWFVGDLDNNESAILKIVVQVIKVGNITNNVNVTGTGHDTNLTNNNASVSVNVPESVLLNITKVANSTIIVAGENVGYTVVINNYGPSVASDVVLKDIFNSNELLNLQYSLNGVDWLDYNEAINLGNIDVGASVTVYFRAKVNGSVRGDVLNTVNITTSVDDARGNFTDNETVKVIANTTLAVIKDAEIKALNPGDTAHFVITVIAGGSSDSLNVKLEDILDAGLLDVKSATHRINGGNLTDYTQIISLGNMHTGSKIVVDIYAAILGTTGQDIFNCVNVTSDEHPEGNTSNTTIHVNIADLEIIKIVNNATPNYGDEITYTITVRNNGPDNSTNIKVSEVLADNFKFISANASKGYYDLTNGVWAVGNLTNNETAKLVITVKIVKTGFIQNNVSVNGTGFDPNVTNNNATVNITVPQTADLSVVKIVNVDRVSVGNRITYTIVVKNNGPDTALDVYAVDKLSDALKFVSYKASVGVYDPATGIWTIGNLTNKSNATLEITCIVLKTGVISNEVFVNGSTVDLNMTNNYGNVSVTVIPAPAPVHPADKDIMDSDEVAMGVDAMAKTGNPILALLVVLIFGIFGFGVSRRKK